MTDAPQSVDPRIGMIIEAAERLSRGNFRLEIPDASDDAVGRLARALQELAAALERRYRELQELEKITAHINAGLLLDDVLANVYRDFRGIIPYNRIGFSLLEDGGQTVRARWARSDQPEVHLTVGSSASLEGSSLKTIMTTGRPRILNDLVAYLRHQPDSESTRLIVAEGLRCSLTCPLIANSVPVGFMFFSSTQPGAYADVHVRLFERIAEQLSVIVEKGRLVSELAAQKVAMEQQNVELRRLDELKNGFLGIAAHDLRNTLAFIQMAVGLVLSNEVGLSAEEQTSLLRDVQGQTQHMLAMLNELLDVSQIESGKLRLEMEPIDLADFLAEAASRHGLMAGAKGTRVILQPLDGGSLQADPLRLRQVVDNLISNAVKYSPPGSTVTLSVERLPAAWKVHVRDEGPGLTAEDRRRLFQHFGKLSARPTGGETSTGLGLAITRRVVKAHGGQIGAESVPGHGADFWFTLPAG